MHLALEVFLIERPRRSDDKLEMPMCESAGLALER